jgi:DNA-binding transcriptional ArsR family regulator
MTIANSTTKSNPAPPPNVRYRRVEKAVQSEYRKREMAKEIKKGRASKSQKRRRSEAWWSAQGDIEPVWQYRIFTREFLSRCIRSQLSATEWSVLDFIFDRTVNWGKQWETIRMSQFVSGSLPDKDGFQAFCGTGLSKRTVQYALEKLEAGGLIVVRDKTNGNGLRELSVQRVDKIKHQIEQQNPEGARRICYRAKWPKTGEIINISGYLE